MKNADMTLDTVWATAPTVYRFAVDGVPAAVIDHGPAATGIASGLNSLIMRNKAISSVADVLEKVFLHDTLCHPGLNASTTRMIIEIVKADTHGNCLYMLHLLLSDDVRISIEMRQCPLPGHWSRIIYSLGMARPGDDWTWSKGMSLFDVQNSTRRNLIEQQESTA